MGILEELKFGKESEDKLLDYLVSIGYKVTQTEATDIIDFVVSKNGKTVNIELKTRRCNKDTYADTLIGANKLARAWDLFYKNGEETLFFFKFEDGLYYINPLEYLPRRQYKLQRFGRGIDTPKGWLYYDNYNLIKIY